MPHCLISYCIRQVTPSVHWLWFPACIAACNPEALCIISPWHGHAGAAHHCYVHGLPSANLNGSLEGWKLLRPATKPDSVPSGPVASPSENGAPGSRAGGPQAGNPVSSHSKELEASSDTMSVGGQPSAADARPEPKEEAQKSGVAKLSLLLTNMGGTSSWFGLPRKAAQHEQASAACTPSLAEGLESERQGNEVEGVSKLRGELPTSCNALQYPSPRGPKSE